MLPRPALLLYYVYEIYSAHFLSPPPSYTLNRPHRSLRPAGFPQTKEPPMPTNIRKSIHITAPIEKVWAALTDPKAIGGWMGSEGLKVTLRKGGRCGFFGGETTGKFTEIRKPNTLEYTWRQSSWKKEWADSV